MANLNRVHLMGRTTRDPEIRYTPKGAQVCELGLATNRVFTDEQGVKKEETTFVDVTLWERQAEIAGQYLAKGRPVFIEGRIELDSWVDKQTGQKRSKLRIVGENVQFLSPRPQLPSAAAPARRDAAVHAPILERATPDDQEVPF
jgi:single-strand DNA-binding protein